MPIPTPTKGEKRDKFVSRCMSFVKGESPDMPNDQAVAICSSQFRRTKQMYLKYEIPITENASINDHFIIGGTAINETTTSNNHKFLAEELRLAAATLTGVPLLVDHDNKVANIKGRVISGNFNESDRKIDFKAKVMDEEMKNMIRDGRLINVSIGASVDEIEEGEDGILIPRGIKFQELSLVAVPADQGATFDIALKEAHSSSQEDNQTVKRRLKTMSEEKETTPEETEAKEESKEESETPAEEEKSEEATEEKDNLKDLITSTIAATIKAMKEADGDESKEEAKEEPKEESKEEAKEEPKEEAEEEESEEEVAEEKAGYRIINGARSFSVLRSHY